MPQSAWSILNRDKSFTLRKVKIIETFAGEAVTKISDTKAQLNKHTKTYPQVIAARVRDIELERLRNVCEAIYAAAKEVWTLRGLALDAGFFRAILREGLFPLIEQEARKPGCPRIPGVDLSESSYQAICQGTARLLRKMRDQLNLTVEMDAADFEVGREESAIDVERLTEASDEPRPAIPEYVSNPRKKWDLMLAELPLHVRADYDTTYSEAEAARVADLEYCPLPPYVWPFAPRRSDQLSEFWRDLGNRFTEKGKEYSAFGATWTSIDRSYDFQNVQTFKGSHARNTHLSQAPADATLLFESLAAMGAKAGGYAGDTPVDAWIDQLRSLGLNCWIASENMRCSYNGPRLHGIWVYFEKLFSSSANFCTKLEREAFEAVRRKPSSATVTLTPQQIANRPSFSQKEAADILDYTDRHIRTLLKVGDLTPASKGRVVNDERFERAIRRRHKPIRG